MFDKNGPYIAAWIHAQPRQHGVLHVADAVFGINPFGTPRCLDYSIVTKTMITSVIPPVCEKQYG